MPAPDDQAPSDEEERSCLRKKRYGDPFCRECAWSIEDSLDRRPFGPDADMIRAAMDHRARVARVDYRELRPS